MYTGDKLPTLFEKKNGIAINRVTRGCEWVLEGEGEATVQLDGECCAIMNGLLYKRKDKEWVKCKRNNPEDERYWLAYDHMVRIRDNVFRLTQDKSVYDRIGDNTYEAIGLHFKGNPYNFPKDLLVRHGLDKIRPERTFKGIRDYLKDHKIEGIVFWYMEEPRCKIKRSDFGFEWPPQSWQYLKRERLWSDSTKDYES